MSARFTTLLVLSLLAAQTVDSQVPEPRFRQAIAYESWSAEEKESLERGNAVVRSLNPATKQEIASLGVVRIKGLSRLTMEEFRTRLDQRSSSPLKSGGKFSDPARDEDVEPLELDKDALDELRVCNVADCNIQLPAEMIRRFQTEVDWNSQDASQRATQIMREMLLKLVREYAERGDHALTNYNNRRKPVDLSEIHRSLLASSLIVNSLAPEFVEYLKQFPSGKLETVQNDIHWSVLDFGLEPSITISHASAYTQTGNGIEQYFVASRQIYSSRYLDASLTFTILLSVDTGSGIENYLIFIDRSRADSFEGPIGRFARGVVKRESMKRIESLLDRAKYQLLATRNPTYNETGAPAEDERSTLGRTIRDPILLAIAAAAVVAVLTLVWYRKRMR